MKLISLNLWGGRARDELFGFLEREKNSTDIFCFQEVLEYSLGKPDHQSSEVENIHSPGDPIEEPNLYSELEKILGQHQGFLSEHYSSGMERLATFVRKGVKASVETLPVIEKFHLVAYGKSYDIGCLMQHASFDIKGIQYDIANTHGVWQHSSKDDTPERIKQSTAILRILSSFRGRKVLVGDFNLLPETRSIGMLEDHMRNLIKDYGITDTRSSLYKKKLRYADYAFVSKDVNVINFGTLDETASDHLPLALEFE